MSEKKYIGIDAGVNTGVAIWDAKQRAFKSIGTMTILQAMKLILSEIDGLQMVIVEDARQVVYKTSREKAQGAGSVKRDCQIWEEFLTENKIRCIFVRPKKQITKWTKEKFESFTGYNKQTSQHGRDAAMLVYGHK